MDSSCFVETILGTRPIGDIRPGDYVKTGDEEYAKVSKVVIIEYQSKEMVELQACGLRIASWCPVSDGDFYVYAKNAEGLKPKPYFGTNAQLYNFVLESPTQTVEVHGVDVPILGHNSNFSVIWHEYWGNRIIRDLKKLAPNETDRIVIDSHQIERNSAGEVVGLK